MYEMSYGRELSEVLPQEQDYQCTVMADREKLEEVIAYIFDKKSQTSFKQVSLTKFHYRDLATIFWGDVQDLWKLNCCIGLAQYEVINCHCLISDNEPQVLFWTNAPSNSSGTKCTFFVVEVCFSLFDVF